ncbi:AAA family ATPase [Cellulomonas sp. KRMCY2]|uniref:AAA family ATPase n=1 Tax=Cellulomonas sp. KRMCY2 TaxID=1304865 RepID=UPI00045EC01F|nr:AAA family ATPase [Cellulomonas sp. KRMCY2]
MRRILLTGMSGTGKSSVVRELVARGHDAVDTDDGWCEPVPGGRQQWRIAAVRELLTGSHADLLFVAGCEENQAVLHDLFDAIVLLSAPADVILSRLTERTTNPYGRTAEDRRRVLDDLADVEPLLRRISTHEIRTTQPLEDVVTAVLRIADEV